SISEFDPNTDRMVMRDPTQEEVEQVSEIIAKEQEEAARQAADRLAKEPKAENQADFQEKVVEETKTEIKEAKKTVETSKPEGNEGISNPTVTEKTSNPTAPNAGTNTTHPATAGTNTTPPAALSQKLQTKQLGALDARTEDKVKDAVLTKNPDLKAADRDKLTVQFVGVRNRATKAKITHSELTGTIKVTFSVKKALNTFTKPTTETITVTQAEVTNPTQDTLNKFLKQDGSLTVNTDVTITFNDVDNKKTATITAAPNSTKAQ
ncbi:hypothetical protein, partial [Candidatus Phytoplasma solani]|uniref:hypothetical protein n=1 Tax=Candidatus Phytoplasma solani TaxID=69896 RepID=UPI0003B7BC20